MDNNNKIVKIGRELISITIVTFAPFLLSPLHLASIAYYKNQQNKKKEFQRVQRRIKTILDRFPDDTQNIDYNDYQQVFFEVYNKANFLSVKDLETLRQFCLLAYNSLNMKESLMEENRDKIDIYARYHGKIENKIDEQKIRKKSIRREKLNYFLKRKR